MENILQDMPKATGQVTIKHLNSAGELLAEYVHKNLVVTTGLQHIAARLADTGEPAQMSHMALGSGATAAQLADSTMESQLGSRKALNAAGGTPSGNTVTYAANFAAGESTGGITEAGIFNASTLGTMLCRTTFPVINKAADDVLAVSWVVTIS